MEKINVAALLEDCPRGMELDCIITNNTVTLEGVVGNGSTYPIRVISKDGFHHMLTCSGGVYDREDSKCVIFPKGKTTWEGFHRPFKDGDIVYICDEYSDATFTYVAIFKQIENGGLIYSHCFYNYEAAEFSTDDYLYDIYQIRFATEEEKEKIFQVIKDNGYKWNPETNTLEKLIVPKFKVGDRIRNKETLDKFIITSIDEDSYYFGCSNYIWIANQDEYELVPDKFDITTLRPFESRVLVRHNRDNKWCGSFFSHIDEDFKSHCYRFVTTSGKSYPMCIPYEDNEHLLGKTDDCDEYFKIWKN